MRVLQREELRTISAGSLCPYKYACLAVGLAYLAFGRSVDALEVMFVAGGALLGICILNKVYKSSAEVGAGETVVETAVLEV